ncbi:MAG: glycoside hydrolase family 88 protein [Faecousia sp.]
MNVRRTSIGNRVLSLVLALVMVIGLVPVSAFPVFAADTTTADNLASIQSYASTLLNSNFSNTSTKPTWDTEGKSDTWRYFNGAMLDALLTLGVDSNAGNALEYAKDYMDANIASDGSITNWHAGELDSVPPAFTLLTLLDTAEVDDATREDYVAAINYVYGQIESQTSYDTCGGNFLHKSTWTDYQIGLDGIYMAQPFLMMYANALADGKITNTVNSKTADDIYQEVYNRLMWVADTMYDSTTGLYNHGWDVTNSKGNGHFWSRGIGWYAAGMVMCIDRMPEGTYKTNLIGKLPKLFDGMVTYQDDTTGLWYNVVNKDSSLTSGNGNKLETSGSALMAYAMLKAYNEGWVDAKYATAGEKAFNGIVANKLIDGKITDIYQMSGVETSDAGYCTNKYVSDEAKGVCGVLLAAAEVDKYLGNSEDYAVGVVVAPEMTVTMGATTLDTSNVKVSLLGGQGSITKDAASQVSYEYDFSAAGDATVTVKNGSATIGTFTVQVVDPNSAFTSKGTIGGGTTVEYELVTSMIASDENNIYEYVLTRYSSKEGNSAYVSGTTLSKEQTITPVAISGKTGYYTLTPNTGSLTLWRVDADDNLYTVIGGTNYYVALTGTSSGNIAMTETSSAGTQYTIAASSDSITFTNKQYTARGLKIDSGGLVNAGSGTGLCVFRKIPAGSEVVLSVAPNTVTVAKDGSSALTTKVTVDGNEVALTECTIAWSAADTGKATVANGTVTGVADGTTTVTATLSQVTIDGVLKDLDSPISVTITVNVGDSTPEPTPTTTPEATEPEEVTFTIQGSNGNSLAGQNITLNKDETFTPTLSVMQGSTDLTGSYTMTLEATTNASAVTINGTTITANQVAEDTVVNITATVAPQSRATASGTSVDFTVTVKAYSAASTSDTGNVTTTESSGSGTSYTGSNDLNTGWQTSKDATSGGSGSGKVYKRVTGAIVSGENYLIVKHTSDTEAVILINTDATDAKKHAGVLNTSVSSDTITLTEAQAAVAEWNFVLNSTSATTAYSEKISCDSYYISNGSYYIYNTASSNKILGTANTLAYIPSDCTSGDYEIILKAQTSPRAVTYDSSSTDPWRYVEDTTREYFYLYALDSEASGGSGEATPAEYAQLQGEGTFTYNVGEKTADEVLAAIQAAYDVYMGTNSDGTGATAQPDSNATWTCLDTYDANTAGTYRVQVTYGENNVVLGTFTVAVNSTAGDDVVTNYNATLTVTPDSLSLTAGETGSLVGEVTAVLASDSTAATVNSSTITWTSTDDTVASVADGVVTAHKAGSATITAKLSAIMVNGLEGAINEEILVTIPVTVTAASSGSGSIVHNFTTDGTTNDFFTITGSLSTGKGSMSYNGQSLTRCLKMESKTSITFKPTTDGTLTLVFGGSTSASGKEVKVNGVSYTADSNGIVTVPVTAGTDYSVTKGDSINLFYMEYASAVNSSITLDSLPVLYVGTTPNTATLADYVTAVMYNGETVADYTIEWSSSDPAVASIADGVVTAVSGGRVTLTAKLTKVGETDVSGENITATVDLVVIAPTISLGEDLTKFVGDTFTLTPSVMLGTTEINDYTLTWTIVSSEGTVVSRNGDTYEFTVGGAGTATIQATVTAINGESVSIDVSDTITVTAEAVTIESGKLSSNTVTVEQTETDNDDAVTTALSGITLTLTKNNGETVFVNHDTLFSGTNVSIPDIDTTVTGTHYVTVTYTYDGYTFTDNIAVKIISAAANKEGVITVETGVTYEIDTDGIDANQEYVIVIWNGSEWVALKNPDATSSGSVMGSSQIVTRSVDGTTITISENADLVEWLFYNQGTSGDFTTFYVSNNKRYIKGGGSTILGSSEKTVYTWQNGDTYFIGMDHSSGKARSLILDGESWTRSSSTMLPDATGATYFYLYKRVSQGDDYGVSLNVPESKNLYQGDIYEVTEDTENFAVTIYGTELTGYTIEWSSSDTSVATVDANGKITAVGAGAATITAKLVDVNGYPVTNNTDNTAGISKEIAVSVTEVTFTYELVGEQPLVVPLGGQPDFSKVSLVITNDATGTKRTIPGTELNIKYADAVAAGFDTTVASASTTVDYSFEGYASQINLIVGQTPYDGLETASSYPQYPEAGAVRMNKFATRMDFDKTGIVKIELNAAGISSRNPVDVVLVVDVSNSMGWSMDWFTGLTDAAVEAANDGDKYDTAKDDKLDYAMKAAQAFAKILLADSSSGNSMSFVTFGGNDLDRGGSTSYMDTVVTAFVGESDLDKVNNSFANTMFTSISGSGSNVTYKLQIAGTDGAAIASGTARGNTIYDFGFLEAIDAVNALKVAKAGSVEAYDASGREVHIIFMTDGAPSHYNDKMYGNNNNSGNRFTSFSGKDAEWLEFIKNPNEDATNLYSMVSDFHIVGYDLAHGGFGSHNWTEAELGRVLGGLVQNKSLDYTLASDTDKLNTFFTDLANNLTYAGTNALVTDLVSTDFILQTKSFTMNNGTVNVPAEIQILERRLVVPSDLGTSLTVIKDGVATPIDSITEEHLGLVVDGGVEVLATVTLDGENFTAYSTALNESDDIWDGDDQTGTITGKYFTYDFATKTFHWNIGNIQDKELALTYYAYLEDSSNLEGEGGKEAGLYATNESATLKYVDTNNQVVVREFPVPQVAWKEASVTVRFYLVNENGQFVNRAGVTFTNPANRIFLDGRAYYTGEFNDVISITAADALLNANLVGNNTLYDPTMAISVRNDISEIDGEDGANADLAAINWTANSALNNIGNLQIATDNSGGKCTAVFVDIPIVMTDLGKSNFKMYQSNVVIDFSNSVQWISLHADEQAANGREYTNAEDGKQYIYTITLMGFAHFNPNSDLYAYIPEAEWPTSFTTDAGTYSVVNSATGEIMFTPKAPLTGTDNVFAVFKFAGTPVDENGNPIVDGTMDYNYLYKQVNVVPATIVHYETTGNMAGAFTTTDATNNGTWLTATGGTAANGNQSNENTGYGFDSSYEGCVNLSGGDSLFVNNQSGSAKDKSKVEFTFTGTGIDIISRTGVKQGLIKLTLTGKNTGKTKTVSVLNKGIDELYQIPVISVEGLPYDTYTAKIEVYCESSLYGGEFYLDAIVVYGGALETEVVGSKTVDGNPVDVTVGDLYKEAGESKPQITEIRDILLNNTNFGGISVSGVNGAVYIDGNDKLEGNSNFSNYDKIGPNNEVYLSKNQAVAFKLKVSDRNNLPASLDIGLKSVGGTSAKAVIYVLKSGETDTTPATYEIGTSTAMFYSLLGTENIEAFLTEDSNEFTVVITSMGESILSVTDLKVGYGTDNVSSVEAVVDTEVGELAPDILQSSAKVVSAKTATVETDEDGNDINVAYTMESTTLTVVTGKGADRIKILDASGVDITPSVSYQDGEEGQRTWTIPIMFSNVGVQNITIIGIGYDGYEHELPLIITVDVRNRTTAETN